MTAKRKETPLERLLRLTERRARRWRREPTVSMLWAERCAGRVDAYEETAARLRRMIKEGA